MKKAFISFDFDNDKFLKEAIIAQSKLDDSPFEIFDMSIKEAISFDWERYAKNKIKGSDIVIVMCGEHTDTATGVSKEINIAIQEGKPYFLLKGYAEKECKKPKAAKSEDKMYNWTWKNLKVLINGGR